MQKIFYLLFAFSAINSFGQKKDTLRIQPQHLNIAGLKKGNTAYIVYNKKSKTSPADRITYVKILVDTKTQEGKPAISISQQWDRDTVIHSAVTTFSPKDFSTLSHDSWWKRLGYTAKFDFIKKTVSFEGKVPDSIQTSIKNDFQKSFERFNLNWHSDLLIFPMLPFKENRVFKINFYDPGFGAAEEVFYEVTGVETLLNSAGEKIECWTLEHHITKPFKGYQKFWISKKGNELLKEEDSFNGQFRYKLKFAVAEN